MTRSAAPIQSSTHCAARQADNAAKSKPIAFAASFARRNSTQAERLHGHETAESTLQPGDRLVPKRRIILAVVDKHFPERKSPMPEKTEPAFLFGQVAPDVTPGDVIPPICRQCRCLCGEAKMGPLDFDKPAMMVKPDLWKIAKEVPGEKLLFLRKDFANSRRGLDVPGFPDPAQLTANGDRVRARLRGGASKQRSRRSCRGMARVNCTRPARSRYRQ